MMEEFEPDVLSGVVADDVNDEYMRADHRA